MYTEGLNLLEQQHEAASIHNYTDTYRKAQNLEPSRAPEAMCSQLRLPAATGHCSLCALARRGRHVCWILQRLKARLQEEERETQCHELMPPSNWGIWQDCGGSIVSNCILDFKAYIHLTRVKYANLLRYQLRGSVHKQSKFWEKG
eukprot:1158631-Pelagomonas_calceolata.AAC.2